MVSLGPIHFAQRVFWTATVTNTSTVPACIKVEMPLLPDPSGLRDAWIEAAPPTWLQLSTHELMDILPGAYPNFFVYAFFLFFWFLVLDLLLGLCLCLRNRT